ncbi:hypothetical protein F0235_03915 [Vibrio splendidus]|uniref:hypothetical protein n=1 Tax=Vibrio splendidus TaxID=29497 RepID=UPI00148CC801|nr:hypothetical protein [Vibrio splendidus]NOI89586.1 hypothetical protein [Vibrio splendidus]
MRIIRYTLLVLFASLSSYAHAISCPLGEVDDGGVCTSVCTVLKSQSRTYTYDAYIWGESPTSACIGQYGSACVLRGSSVSISVDPTKRMWSNSFTFTGEKCSSGDSFSGDSAKPFPWEGDINMNGVLDSEEDWDGDGIPNHSDANPESNDNVVADTDADGIPDRIQSDYDKLVELKEIKNYNCVGGLDCMNTKAWSDSVRELSKNQNDLVGVIDKLVRTGITRKQFNEALDTYNGGLNETIINGHQSIRQDISHLHRNFIERTGNINEIPNRISNMGANLSYKFVEMDKALSEVEQNILNQTYALDYRHVQAKQLLLDVQYKLDNLEVDVDLDELSLSETDSNRLRNAAKASANQKILKRMESSQKEMTTNVSGLSDQVTVVDGKLDSLNTQLGTLSSQIDGIDGSDMSGVESKLTDLINGVTNNNNFVEPNYGFNGEGFIVTQNQIAEVQNEVTEIKQEMTDEFEKFKALFSIDTSSFNNGTYKEHSLNLNVNHAERSFKSGVLSALLENATIISAVVMFLFVLSGIRMLGKD